MAYLIFNSKEEAQARSEQAGKAKGYAFWTQNSGTKLHWGFSEEASEEDPRAYIEIVKNVWTDEESGEEHTSIPDQALLTEEEIQSLASELPEDWVYPPDPMAEDNDEDSDDEDDADEPPLAD